MSEETLLTAARRVVRFFNIDQQHGGLVSIDTLRAVETLDVQVSREALLQKHAENPSVEIAAAK
jgi:hypothetical protein